MEIVADLHLHSKYSRAVSARMELPTIASWARIKGISLVGTGDWTYPLWLNELKSQLEEVEEGLFRLKKEMWGLGGEVDSEKLGEVRFLLVTEISSIYTQGGKQRRIHNLVLAPSFAVVEKINQALLAKGCNLSSDGRPIIGLSAKQLCDLVFGISEDCLVIPAHIWTPWFSLFGANSGFDSLGECFGEFSERIYAIETGLSSDPAMNWRIGELDQRAIVSFSDSHSPENLGREATVFEIEDPKDTKILRYKDIQKAIMQESEDCRIAYTIEFFPQEGKYHYTGHRNCGVCQSPEETAKKGAICPVCGKKLTIGVMQRVEDLAVRGKEEVRSEKCEVSREVQGVRWENRSPYVVLVPLREIIAESLGIGTGAKGVEDEYFKLVNQFGSEFAVLLNAKVAKIAEVSGKRIAEGIQKVRDRDLYIKPGFDGVFGKVRIWGDREEEEERESEQIALF